MRDLKIKLENFRYELCCFFFFFLSDKNVIICLRIYIHSYVWSHVYVSLGSRVLNELEGKSFPRLVYFYAE